MFQKVEPIHTLSQKKTDACLISSITCRNWNRYS